MVHSLTCAGVLPVQYIKLSKFAGIGHVGHGYMKKGTKKNFVEITDCTVCSVLRQWIL